MRKYIISNCILELLDCIRKCWSSTNYTAWICDCGANFLNSKISYERWVPDAQMWAWSYARAHAYTYTHTQLTNMLSHIYMYIQKTSILFLVVSIIITKKHRITYGYLTPSTINTHLSLNLHHVELYAACVQSMIQTRKRMHAEFNCGKRLFRYKLRLSVAVRKVRILLKQNLFS